MRFLGKFGIFVFAIFISSTSFSAQSPVPANGTLIVLNKSDASVAIISLKNNQTIVTIPTADGPHGECNSSEQYFDIIILMLLNQED